MRGVPEELVFTLGAETQAWKGKLDGGGRLAADPGAVMLALLKYLLLVVIVCHCFGCCSCLNWVQHLVVPCLNWAQYLVVSCLTISRLWGLIYRLWRGGGGGGPGQGGLRGAAVGTGGIHGTGNVDVVPWWAVGRGGCGSVTGPVLLQLWLWLLLAAVAGFKCIP